MVARDLMTPNPHVVTGSEPVSHVARLMRDLDIGMIPIVDDAAHRHPRGVITDRDVLVRCVAERHEMDRPVEQFMSGGHLVAVSPDAGMQEVLQSMARGQVRRLIVVENGRIVGVISQADLLLRLGSRDPLRVEQALERISEPRPVPV
jgi:CBS domain-containing protein